MYRRRYPFGWTWRDFDEMMTEMENRTGSGALQAGFFLQGGSLTA